jgi:hypothetical protein
MSEQEKKVIHEEEKGRTIRNQDIITLSNVLYAMQDVSMTEQKRMWLQERLFSMSQRITGMPGGGPKSGMEDKFAIIDELEEKYTKENEAFLRELHRAEEILNNIRNRKMRTFVMKLYVFGAGNVEMQKDFSMSRRKFDQIRKSIEQAPDMAHVKWAEPYMLKG